MTTQEPFEKWLELHNFYINSGSYQTKELAEYLHLSRRTIEHWIKGKSRVKEAYQEMIKIFLDTKDKSGKIDNVETKDAL